MNESERTKLVAEAKKIRDEHTKLQRRLSQLKARYEEIQKQLDSKTDSAKGDATQEEEADFRNVRWGMSREQILRLDSAEELQSEEDSDWLFFNDEIGSQSATIGYQCFDDQLRRVQISFEIEHSNPNLYIDDFEYLESLLLKKYGDASIESEPSWNRETYKDDPSDWGRAIEVGDLSYIAEWRTARTIIYLWLRGDNFEITLSLSYRDRSSDEEQSDNHDVRRLSGL